MCKGTVRRQCTGIYRSFTERFLHSMTMNMSIRHGADGNQNENQFPVNLDYAPQLSMDPKL